MTKLFLVSTYQSDNDVGLEHAISTHYRDSYYVIGRGQWMITADTTASRMAETLGILTDGSQISGTYVVCLSEYAGRARNELGEWMDAKAPRRPLFKPWAKAPQAHQPFFWHAKRLVVDLAILLVSAAMSFLVAYVLLSSGSKFH